MNTLVKSTNRVLTASEFQGLANVPPELEWFANIDNPCTRRAYKRDVSEFSNFIGITTPEEMRQVTRAHVIAWRKDIESRNLAPSSIRRKLSAISALFNYLCEKNSVSHNPVDGVKRPAIESNEGKTPALSDSQARLLLEAPKSDTIKGKRDRAILATLLYHGIRRTELCNLAVKDVQNRKGVEHLRVLGKGNKIRYLPIHPKAKRLIFEYLEEAGHINDVKGVLFRPVKNNSTGTLNKQLNADSIYRHVVRKYGAETGINIDVVGLCVHSLRATAATNALDNEADIAKVQEWLGHVDISTTRLYDRRKTKPEDSPTFRVHY